MSDSDNGKYFRTQEAEEELKHYQFESKFFYILAESEDLELIPIPDYDGKNLQELEKISILEEARLEGRAVLYRISLGEIAVVFAPGGEKLGILPENELHGFFC